MIEYHVHKQGYNDKIRGHFVTMWPSGDQTDIACGNVCPAVVQCSVDNMWQSIVPCS